MTTPAPFPPGSMPPGSMPPGSTGPTHADVSGVSNAGLLRILSEKQRILTALDRQHSDLVRKDVAYRELTSRIDILAQLIQAGKSNQITSGALSALSGSLREGLKEVRDFRLGEAEKEMLAKGGGGVVVAAGATGAMWSG